jgi:hypothetical protein
MLGGPQSRSGRSGEEKNLALPEIEPGPFGPSTHLIFFISTFPLISRIDNFSENIFFLNVSSLRPIYILVESILRIASTSTV